MHKSGTPSYHAHWHQAPTFNHGKNPPSLVSLNTLFCRCCCPTWGFHKGPGGNWALNPPSHFPAICLLINQLLGGRLFIDRSIFWKGEGGGGYWYVHLLSLRTQTLTSQNKTQSNPSEATSRDILRKNGASPDWDMFTNRGSGWNTCAGKSRETFFRGHNPTRACSQRNDQAPLLVRNWTSVPLTFAKFIKHINIMGSAWLPYAPSKKMESIDPGFLYKHAVFLFLRFGSDTWFVWRH